MRIEFSPAACRWPDPVMTVAGDVLTIDGVELDFTQLEPAGAYLPDASIEHQYVLGARRDAGEVVVTILLPAPPPTDPERAFPVPVTVTEGPVAIPGVPPVPEQLEIPETPMWS